MTDSTLETVLRRDRLVIAGALGVIIVLAWGYLLWLAADMDMGGMDMTGFRMIPAGMGIMAPANAPWRAIEFAFVFAMWAVMMVGMMAPSAAPMILMYARVGRQGKAEGKPLAATGWFAAGYFLAWIGFSLAATLVQWVIERAALLDSTHGERQQHTRRNRADCGGRLPMDTAQRRLSRPMPVAVPVPDAPWRLSRRFAGLPAAGASPRSLLRRLLLGSDGTFVCGRCDERALDRAPRSACSSRETHSVRTVDRTRRRRCVCRCGRRDVVIFAAVMSRLLIHANASFTTSLSSAPCHAD